jgi:anti-sigma-K factor RskA
MGTGHEAFEQTIASYVLDALEPDERLSRLPELLEHIAGCPSCRSTFQDLREVTGDLALATPPIPVPVEVEDRIMRSVRGETQDADTQLRRRAWPVRTIAAAAVAVILALGAANLQIASILREERARSLRTSRALAVMVDPATKRTALTSTRVAGAVWMAVRTDGSAVLIGLGLAEPPKGRVLQLWLMQRGGPTSAAVFVPIDGVAVVSLRVDSSAYDAAAITLEPGPDGSTLPTTSPIFDGSLRA